MKKEIGTINTWVLNIRYCHLLDKGEKIPAHEFSIGEAREILWIEDELHRRVIMAVGHDFYPPDRVEEKKALKCNLSNEREGLYVKPEPPSQSKTIKELLQTAKPKPAPGTKIKFNIVVTSSIGTQAAKFTVEADTKAEADLKALAEIRKLGLKRATHKIT